MKAQKITGKEISKATGISESAISKFLTGKQEPKFTHILKIAEALNLPPEVFMAVINSPAETNEPFINEFYLIRDVYNDKYSNMIITVMYAFKDFVMNAQDVVDDEALYITIILEGGTDSKLGSLRKGDYRIVKGTTIKNVEVTISKNTKAISFIIYDKQKSIPENWSQLIFDNLKP